MSTIAKRLYDLVVWSDGTVQSQDIAALMREVAGAIRRGAADGVCVMCERAPAHSESLCVECRDGVSRLAAEVLPQLPAEARARIHWRLSRPPEVN